MAEEKITVSHLVTGAVQPKTAIKSFVFGLWIFFFVAIGFTVYRAWFKPLPTQHQDVTVEKGGTANITTIYKDKKAFIPFIEVYVDQRSEGTLGTGIRAGVRFEF